MRPTALDGARQGLARAERQVSAAAGALGRPAGASARAGGGADRVELSGDAPVDPVDAALSLKTGERLYRANVKVIAIADELLGDTIDLLG